MDNFGSEEVDPDIADSVDFLVEKVKYLFHLSSNSFLKSLQDFSNFYPTILGVGLCRVKIFAPTESALLNGFSFDNFFHVL